MSWKEYHQCRYCKNYKAYDFYGFDGVKIYACENEIARTPCVFEYDKSREDSGANKEEKND